MRRPRHHDTEPTAAPGQGTSGVHAIVAGHPRVVLVVDDHEDLRFVVAEVLRETGLRVITVASAPDALLALASHRPDVVLSDVFMPGTSGIELAARIRAEASLDGVPVVLMSAAHDTEGVAVAAAELGCPLVPKTLDGAGDLVAAIRDALAGTRRS